MGKSKDKEELSSLLRQGLNRDPRQTRQCPEYSEIAAYVEDALPAEAIQPMRRHIADCTFCLDRVGFLARLRDVQAPTEVPNGLLAQVRDLPGRRQKEPFGPGWRWAAASAAAAAAVVVVMLSVGQRRDLERLGPSEVVTTDRASAAEVRAGLELLPPPEVLWPREGSVIRRGELELRWTEVPRAIFYDVRLVTADGDRVWDGRVEGSRQRIPADIQLEAGQELFVWIRTYLPEGKTLQSGMVGFQVGTDAPPQD